MKRRWFFFLNLVALMTAQVLGQTQQTHNLKGINFNSSDRYSSVQAKSLSAEVVMLVGKKRATDSVFVIVPQSRQELRATVEQMRDKLAVSLLPNEPTQYQWRFLEKPYVNTAGKYDVARGQMMGLNNQSCVLLEYHLISFQNKEIIVGYLYVTATGERAAWNFQKSTGGGNGDTGNECALIIQSITGEEEPKVRVGQPPPAAIGAPPPPAPKKP